MCPVCTKKLKQNLKFDTGARFERLAEVCDELGFSDEAAIYRKILSDSVAAGTSQHITALMSAKGSAKSV